MRTIWWDMDGTLNKFYDFPNWLPMLRAEDPTPYAEAKVMWNMSQLARLMNRVQQMGYKLGIISWGAKFSTPEYLKAVTEAKESWLEKHLASVNFDQVVVVSYGTPKSIVMQTEDDILFDDEQGNRDAWLGEAYEPEMMFTVLKNLLGVR